MKVWGPRILAVVVSIGAVLLLLELVLGRRTPRSGAEFFADPPDGLDVPWVLEPGADVAFEGHYVKIAPTRVRISEQGFREDRTYDTADLVFLGDSFVFGSGVEVQRTFAERFEADTGRPTANLGVPGYNSGHALAFFEHNGLPLKPKGVVLFLSDNDFYAQGEDRLAERKARGDQWAVERYVEGRQKGKDKADASYRRDPDAALAAISAAITRLEQLGEQHGFEAKVFLLFPHPLEDRIRALGVERLTDAAYLKDIEDLQIPRDLHPNVEGHRRLAELLTTKLEGWP